MSVLVKGMEMPKNCWRCCLSQLYEKPRDMLVCKITHEEVLRHKIDGNCPLVPVPPHGGLGDLDALIEKVIAKYLEHERKGELVFAAAEIKQDIVDLISDAPTVISSDKDGET